MLNGREAPAANQMDGDLAFAVADCIEAALGRTSLLITAVLLQKPNAMFEMVV